jgi:Family of unknown function (DUF6527)
MTPRTSLRHQFVEFIPEDLSEDTLYISIRFATVSHLCCCGCRNKVVTPLHPTGWKLIFDGKTVSLSPSVGNWNFLCRSHYFIENNRVKWASQWSDQKISAAMAYDRLAKDRYYNNRCDGDDASRRYSEASESCPKKGFWSRLKEKFQSRRL